MCRCFSKCARELEHCVVFHQMHAFYFMLVSVCVFARRIAAHARLPLLQPATIFGRRVGTGVCSHGSSFGRPACHRGAYES